MKRSVLEKTTEAFKAVHKGGNRNQTLGKLPHRELLRTVVLNMPGRHCVMTICGEVLVLNGFEDIHIHTAYSNSGNMCRLTGCSG